MKDGYSTVVIEVALDPATNDQLKSLANSSILKSAKKIYMMHVFSSDMKHYAPNLFKEMPNFEKTGEIINDELEGLKKTLFGESDILDKVETRFFFDKNVKIRAVEFLKSVEADLVIAATRGEHGIEGLFTSSFSYFLIDHSPCDVHILRPLKK